MTGRIILVRHGQTTCNVDHLLDTAPPGAELTQLGQNQAHDVGEELAQYCEVSDGDLGRVVACYSSIAIRAQQTAMRLTSALSAVAGLTPRALPVTPVMGIHELSAGDYELRNDDDAHRRYSLCLANWMAGDTAARMPGSTGENIEEFLKRFQPVLENITAKHLSSEVPHDVIVVSHGAAIRTIACHATGIDPEFAFAGYLPNCRYIVLSPQGQAFGRWKLLRWADMNQQI